LRQNLAPRFDPAQTFKNRVTGNGKAGVVAGQDSLRRHNGQVKQGYVRRKFRPKGRRLRRSEPVEGRSPRGPAESMMRIGVRCAAHFASPISSCHRLHDARGD